MEHNECHLYAPRAGAGADAAVVGGGCTGQVADRHVITGSDQSLTILLTRRQRPARYCAHRPRSQHRRIIISSSSIIITKPQAGKLG